MTPLNKAALGEAFEKLMMSGGTPKSSLREAIQAYLSALPLGVPAGNAEPLDSAAPTQPSSLVEALTVFFNNGTSTELYARENAERIMAIIRQHESDHIGGITEMVKDKIKRLIRETLDSPTIVEPKANCRNLTRCLQDIERLVS